MAKKKTGRVSSKKREKIIMENVLPQNVLPIGEHVEEDKNIYMMCPPKVPGDHQ